MAWCSSPESGAYYYQFGEKSGQEILVYELVCFQRDAMSNSIWIKTVNPSYKKEWEQYCSLYFSNGVIGIYNPEEYTENGCLRVEFSDPLDALSIEEGMTFSFLNQFDKNIENSVVMNSVKNLKKTLKSIRDGA